MHIDAQILTFIGIAFVLVITPGVDTILVVRSAVMGGTRAGLESSAGICMGLLVHATLSALGVSLILMKSAEAFTVLKLAGAAYLVWLGIQSLRSAARGEAHGEDAQQDRQRGWYLQGFLSNLLNPKVAAFYLALLPQFIGPDDAVLLKSFVLASLHLAISIVWLVLLSVVAAQGRRRLAGGRAGRWMHAISGTVLVGLGAKLAVLQR